MKNGNFLLFGLQLENQVPPFTYHTYIYSHPGGYISARFAVGKTVLYNYTSVGINLPDVAGSNRGK